MEKCDLQDLPEGAPLRIQVDESWDFSTFHHTDGMYSFCTTSEDVPFHLNRFTPMKLVDGRWEIDFNSSQTGTKE